jgi:pSer/pThr/pTyr-binding forkhead associated (FHA) protein
MFFLGIQTLLVDLRSANGTFINGKKILPYVFTEIAKGD